MKKNFLESPNLTRQGFYFGDIQAAAGIKTADPKILSLLPLDNTFRCGIRRGGHIASRSTCTLTSTRASRGAEEKGEMDLIARN